MADKKVDDMEKNVVKAILLQDSDGDVILKDGCYVFELCDNTGRQLNVPHTLIDLSKGSVIMPISDNTLAHLMFASPTPEENVTNINTSPTLGNEDSSDVAEWTEQSSKLLIDLYKGKKPLVESRKIKTMKKMWEEVKQGMDKMGYNFTSQQCESKLKTLERAYKKMLVNNKSTGRGRKPCQFEKELSNILSKRESIFPTLTMGTGPPISRNEHMEESGVTEFGFQGEDSFSEGIAISSGHSVQSTPSPTPTAVASPASSIPRPSLRGRSVQRELQELRKLVEKRQADKHNIEIRKLEQKDELIKQLKLKNKLMEKYLEAKFNIPSE